MTFTCAGTLVQIHKTNWNEKTNPLATLRQKQLHALIWCITKSSFAQTLFGRTQMSRTIESVTRTSGVDIVPQDLWVEQNWFPVCEVRGPRYLSIFQGQMFYVSINFNPFYRNRMLAVSWAPWVFRYSIFVGTVRRYPGSLIILDRSRSAGRAGRNPAVTRLDSGEHLKLPSILLASIMKESRDVLAGCASDSRYYQLWDLLGERIDPFPKIGCDHPSQVPTTPWLLGAEVTTR